MFRFSYLIIIIVLFHCLTFCERDDKNYEIKVINSFEDTLYIKGKKTAIKDEEVLSSLRLYDSLLVLTLHPALGSMYLYRVYNIRTEKCLGEFLIKGRGPDEFSDLNFILTQSECKKDNEIKIWIKEFPTKIVLLNLTRTLANGKTVIERKYDFVRPGKANLLYESNDLYVLDEDQFLMNIDLERSGNSDSNHSGPFYVLYDYSGDRCSDTLRYRYDLPGWASINEDKTRIVKVSYWEDVISLYDIQTGKERVICHTKKLPDELYGLENRSVKKPDYVYRTCFFSGDFIFTLYRANEETFGKETPVLPSVHIFDTDGNPLYNLLLGEAVENICFDGRARILYGLDSGGRLYAYDLADVLGGK